MSAVQQAELHVCSVNSVADDLQWEVHWIRGGAGQSGWTTTRPRTHMEFWWFLIVFTISRTSHLRQPRLLAADHRRWNARIFQMISFQVTVWPGIRIDIWRNLQVDCAINSSPTERINGTSGQTVVSEGPDDKAEIAKSQTLSALRRSNYHSLVFSTSSHKSNTVINVWPVCWDLTNIKALNQAKCFTPTLEDVW